VVVLEGRALGHGGTQPTDQGSEVLMPVHTLRLGTGGADHTVEVLAEIGEGEGRLEGVRGTGKGRGEGKGGRQGGYI
jgi:hypothetical protein